MEERKDGNLKPSFREKTRFQIPILVSVELETNAEGTMMRWFSLIFVIVLGIVTGDWFSC